MATGEIRRLLGTPESVSPSFVLSRESGWKIYFLIGSVVLAGFLVVPSLRVGPLFNVIALSGALAIIFTLRRHRPEQRIPWLLVAVGQIVFVGGDIITYNYERFFGGEPPFPSLGDLFYLTVYPFLVAGILLMIRRRSPGRDRASLIDSLIIGFGVGTLSWVFLIAPYLYDPTLTVYQKVVAMAYPVMDLVLLTVAVRLGMGAGKRSAGFYLMMGSIGVLFITDVIYGWIVLHGGYDNSTGYLEAGWGLFYLLLGASALHLTTPLIETPEPEHEPTQPRLRVLLLACAALMAPAVNIVQSLRGEAVDVPIVSAAGALMFIFVLVRLNGLMVDITQYRRTARALTEAEAKYRSLVEGLPAVVYVADFGEQGDFTYVSPQIESVLGFRPDEFQTAAFWKGRIVPEDRARAVDAELRLAAGNTRLEVEYRILGKDGREVWIREDADAVRDENGIPLYLQGVMYDVTEQKTIEQKLVKALETEKETNRIRSEFVLMINHELRTPLTSVVSGAEVIADLDLPEDDRQMIIADMLRDGRRLDGLISQMLTVARIENSGLNFSLTRTEVSSVMERIRQTADSRLYALDDAWAGDAVVNTDRDALVQLLTSLADNAFTHGASKVAIQVTPTLRFNPMHTVGVQPPQTLFFLVLDNGPGIDREFLPRAFGKFEKHSRSSGTGLGLYLARLMVEAMQGAISVHTGPTGTIMAVGIPLVSVDGPTPDSVPVLASNEHDATGASLRLPPALAE